MTRRAYDDETELLIVKLYKTGMTCEKIARQVGGSGVAVGKALKRQGVPRRSYADYQPWTGSPEQKAEVLRIYAETGSVRGVSRALKCRTDRITETLVAAGVYLGPRRGNPRFRGAVAAEMARAYEAGASLKSLAEKYDTNSFTVTNTIGRCGVVTRPTGRPEFWTEERLAWLKTEFLAGKTRTALAHELDLRRAVVTALLRKIGALEPENRSGPNSASWRGGRWTTADGYVYVMPQGDDVNFCKTYSSGRVLEHRLVMGRAIGRPLTRRETVHHINGDRGDNRIENLQLRFGLHGNGVALECYTCGSCNVGPVPLAG